MIKLCVYEKWSVDVQQNLSCKTINESEKGVCVFDRSGENRTCKPATEGRDENKVDGKNE